MDSEIIIGDIAQVFGPCIKFIVVEANGEVKDRLRMLASRYHTGFWVKLL